MCTSVFLPIQFLSLAFQSKNCLEFISFYSVFVPQSVHIILTSVSSIQQFQLNLDCSVCTFPHWNIQTILAHNILPSTSTIHALLCWFVPNFLFVLKKQQWEESKYSFITIFHMLDYAYMKQCAEFGCATAYKHWMPVNQRTFICTGLWTLYIRWDVLKFFKQGNLEIGIFATDFPIFTVFLSALWIHISQHFIVVSNYFAAKQPKEEYRQKEWTREEQQKSNCISYVSREITDAPNALPTFPVCVYCRLLVVVVVVVLERIVRNNAANNSSFSMLL